MVTEISLQHDRGRSTDTGSTLSQHEYRIDPNEIRRLPPGMCVAIGNGQTQKIQIKPVPDLPEQDAAPEPSDQPPDQGAFDLEPDEPIRL